MIGVAETGSGKTLAFLLPFFEQLSHLRAISSNEPEDDDEKEERPSQGAVGLVLAPTRELVLQIESEYAKFAKSMGLAPPVAIVGGHSMTGQSFRLSEGVVDMIIATPGRLKDCLEQHVLSLRSCRYLVLDEADRMVDMGFEEDLTAILGCLPRNQYDGRVQKILFSATMPPGVERIARTYLAQVASFGTSSKLSTTDKTVPSHGLAVVTIGTAGQVVDRIEQRVELLSSDYQKRTRLFEVLGQLSASATGANGPIIIFVNHKETVDSVTRHLNSQDYKAIGLHGGRSQEQRESALQHLKSGKMNVLVATDVASRGIDVPNVSLVLNYDMAPSIESYIHRIGRTGRAGKLGLAHTFLVATQDAPLFYDLKNLLLKSSKSTCPRDLSEHEAANTKPGTIPQKKKSDETIFK